MFHRLPEEGLYVYDKGREGHETKEGSGAWTYRIPSDGVIFFTQFRHGGPWSGNRRFGVKQIIGKAAVSVAILQFNLTLIRLAFLLYLITGLIISSDILIYYALVV